MSLIADILGGLMKAGMAVAKVTDHYRECPQCFGTLPRSAFTFMDGWDSVDDARICATCYKYRRALTDHELKVLRFFAEDIGTGYSESGTSDAAPPSPLEKIGDSHFYVIGKSGTGKTTYLKALAKADLDAGDGFAFIDPHGDAVTELLAHVPPHRFDDLIYFDPTSVDCPSFNLLALPYRPDKLVADLVSLFKLFFGSSWGQQLEMILQNALATLVADREHEPHTLADLRRLLVDEDYRDAVTGRLTRDELSQWWRLEYPALAKTAANPVLNRLNAFMPPLSPLARLFAQRENALDFTAILNKKQVLLVNLSKGELGNEPSRLLGGMITASIAQAALARSPTPEAQRIPFHLIADEFQSYVVESFELILSEARKYRLTMALANQTLAQLPPALRAAIFGNVGALVAFSVAADDATQLKKEMRSTITVHSDGTPYDATSAYATTIRALVAAARSVLAAVHLYPPTRAAPATVSRVPDTVSVTRDWLKAFESGSENKSIASVLSTLARVFAEGRISPRRPSDLKEVEYPRVDDFLTLRPLRAIARVGGADQVSKLYVNFLPATTAEERDAVLAHLRKKARPTILGADGHPMQPPPQEQEKKKKPTVPQTEEDEFF